MTESIFIVKGISGSGKSSRVFQLLKYCECVGFTLEDFKYVNIEGKEKVIGVLVKELDLIFIGKVYCSGQVERWQGYDSVTGAFCKAKHFSEFLQDNLSKYSFIVEGAGITQTNRLRPKFLEEIGFKKILLQYYNYPEQGKEEYYNRIIYRSGEKPKKDVMWDKNLGFINDAKFSLEEINNVSAEVEIYIDEFEEPLYDFGVKFFLSIGEEPLIYEFIDFVEEFDYISKNKFENFN